MASTKPQTLDRQQANRALYRRRAKVMDHARALARSGEHADHKSIIALLTAQEDDATIRNGLEAYAFRAQLDRLCALARGSALQIHLALACSAVYGQALL